MKIKFSNSPFKGEFNRYHILYATICFKNKKFYIGVHSSLKEKDNYYGCGITSNINNPKSIHTKRSLNRSPLWRAVQIHRIINFKREEIFFFQKRKDLVAFEKLIVNKEFIKQSFVYNATVGGNMPPTNRGKDNGNYGNTWSKKQRQDAKDYFKANRDTKRGKNIKAKKTFILDIITDKVSQFDCIRDAEDFVKVKHGTLCSLNTLNQFHVFRKRFIYVKHKPTKKQIKEIYQEVLKTKFKFKDLILNKKSVIN